MTPRLALCLTLFWTGAAVLALEVLASRLMVPLFGSSLFIWGAVLSVTLVCLAVGYGWGGRLADRLDDPRRRLTLHILLAAGWIGALPLWGPALLRIGLWTGSVAGPIAVAVVVFAAPITLLATAVPLAFGALQRVNPSRPGRDLGNLFAVSTAGSVAGALAGAYLAVPLLGVQRSLLVVALALLAAALPPMLAGVARRSGLLVLAVLVLGELLPAEARGVPRYAPGVRLLAQIDSRYGHLDVLEDARDGSRVLLLDGASQTWAHGTDWRRSRFRYVDAILEHLPRFAPQGDRALVIGLGGGSLVGDLAARGFRVDAVEIDPAVHEAALAYFGLRPDDARVHLEDGRAFLTRAGTRADRWDVIILDATGGGHFPEHLYNADAYRKMTDVLAPGGVVFLNLVAFTKPPDRVARHSAASLSRALDHVEAYDLDPDGDPANLANVLLVGSARAPRAPAGRLDRALPVDRSLRPLTDDWNPMPLWAGRTSARWHHSARRWLGDAALIPWR